MSDTNNTNLNPNTNGTNDQANGNNGGNAPAQQKDNFIVAGFKRVCGAVSNGWKAVKASPWTHAIAAFGGTVGGGYLGYKLAESMRPPMPEPAPVPQIPDSDEKMEEQTQTSSTVEYVDIPKDEPVTEEQ